MGKHLQKLHRKIVDVLRVGLMQMFIRLVPSKNQIIPDTLGGRRIRFLNVELER